MGVVLFYRKFCIGFLEVIFELYNYVKLKVYNLSVEFYKFVLLIQYGWWDFLFFDIMQVWVD